MNVIMTTKYYSKIYLHIWGGAKLFKTKKNSKTPSLQIPITNTICIALILHKFFFTLGFSKISFSFPFLTLRMTKININHWKVFTTIGGYI